MDRFAVVDEYESENQVDGVKIPELADNINTSESTIERNINKLKSEKKLVRLGSKKDGFWKLKNM